jgi:hypothetical protein
MDEMSWQEIETLFNDASNLPSGERLAFLEAACGDNQEVYNEVTSLLNQLGKNESFFENNVFHLGFRLLSDCIKEEQILVSGAHRITRR